MPDPHLIATLATFAASVLSCRIAIFLARKAAFVDRPGREAHKLQDHPVPYGGGLAMAMAMAMGLGAAWLLRSTDPHGQQSLPRLPPLRMTAIWGGALVLMVMGIVDDARGLKAPFKLAVQAMVAALAVILADWRIHSLQHLEILSRIVAWLWIVLVTNAYNLIDHADGLSATVGGISAIVLLTYSLLGGDMDLAQVWLCLIAALGGFLVFNLPPARLYMGDAGSLPLGYLIAAGTLSVTFWPSDQGGSPLTVMVPVLITAIPLFDTLVVILKRLRRHRPIMLGDRSHISHRLGRLGLGQRTSLATIAALQLALAAGALQLRSAGLLPGLVVMAQSAGILLAVVLMETNRDAGP